MKFTFYKKEITVEPSPLKCVHCGGSLFVSEDQDEWTGPLCICPHCRRGYYLVSSFGPVMEGDKYDEQRLLNAVRDEISKDSAGR